MGRALVQEGSSGAHGGAVRAGRGEQGGALCGVQVERVHQCVPRACQYPAPLKVRAHSVRINMAPQLRCGRSLRGGHLLSKGTEGDDLGFPSSLMPGLAARGPLCATRP